MTHQGGEGLHERRPKPNRLPRFLGKFQSPRIILVLSQWFEAGDQRIGNLPSPRAIQQCY
jgi:hypothetical protein